MSEGWRFRASPVPTTGAFGPPQAQLWEVANTADSQVACIHRRVELDNAGSHMNDNGPRPNAFDIETLTVDNTTYRTVAWTGRYLQVTVMSIPVGESIGLENHPETDQFLRLDAGRGRVVMGPSREDLPFSQDVEDGWAVTVPAGTWHDIINTGDEPMQLYAIYAPVHHAAGRVHPTAADSEADEEAGTDEPPEWSVQP